MKRAASLVLLGIFLFNIAGVFCLYAVLQHLNYGDIFNRSESELNLVRLIVPKTETLHWKNRHEIVFDGKCYDVLGRSEDDKNYFLVCHADSKEDLLNEALNSHVSFHQDTDQKCGDSHFSIKIFIKAFILHSLNWRIEFTGGEQASFRFSAALSQGFPLAFYLPPKALLTYTS